VITVTHHAGCRGAPPTEAPHTRWRDLGPGIGRTAATGSASGPAITLGERRWFLARTSRFAGTPRVSIGRSHSCACAAVSDSHARSCGSSSRPSGVTSRPPLNEKAAQGPVSFRSRTIRLHARVGADAAARTAPASHAASNIIYIMRNVVFAESGPLLAPHGNGWASGSAPASALRPPSLV